MEISKIPSTGNPPNRRYQTRTVVDTSLNRLITFGGYDTVIQDCISSLTTFDLNTNSWGEIIPESSSYPQSAMGAIVYLRSDRKLLVLFGETDSGISSGIYTFDLNTYYWKIEYLLGDPIMGRAYAGSTSFTYQDTTYLGIFGGITRDGTDNKLYL